MKPGDSVFVYDMYGGIVSGVVITQEQYCSYSHWRGTGGATLVVDESLPVRLKSSIGVYSKDNIFSTYDEALVYRAINS